MPTYDYICDSCKHEFEAFESIKADPQTECPACHAQTLRRKIGTGAAILFKGSGFYQTDYRSDSYKKAAEADKPAGETKSEGKEAKTASTTEAKSAPEKSKTESKPASPPPAPAPKEKKPKAKT